MSMEHKAFLFNTEKFHERIEKVMEQSIENSAFAKQYINQHYNEFCSPYTGITLKVDWEKELVNGTLQEYFDFLLTACYEVNTDMGLGYMWDVLNEGIAMLNVFDLPQIVVLGNLLRVGSIQVNPGGMGLGIVESDQIFEIQKKLLKNKGKVEELEIKDLLYADVTREEVAEAYDDLCNIYEEAMRQGKGLMFTF